MDYETDTCEKQSLGDSAQLFSLPLVTAHAKYPCAILKLFSLVMGSSLVKKKPLTTNSFLKTSSTLEKVLRMQCFAKKEIVDQVIVP